MHHVLISKWRHQMTAKENGVDPKMTLERERERGRRRDSPTSQPSVSSNNDELIIIIVIYDALDMSLVFPSLSVSHLVSVLWYHLFFFLSLSLSLSLCIRWSTHIRLIRKSSLRMCVRVHLHQTTRLLPTHRWEWDLLASPERVSGALIVYALNSSYFVKVRGKKKRAEIRLTIFNEDIYWKALSNIAMMIYLTRFDGQHKQCLVCSGILEAKCTLIGCAIDRSIERETRERESEKIFNWWEEKENKCVCVCLNDNRVWQQQHVHSSNITDWSEERKRKYLIDRYDLSPMLLKMNINSRS